MKRRSFLQSLNDAAEGFIHVVRYERSMRIHFLTMFLILLLAALLNVTRLEWVVLCSVSFLVIVAEMANTVIEKLIDLLHPGYNSTVRIIKDISAGMVLASALNAFVVGFFIFLEYLHLPVRTAALKLRYTAWYVTFIELLFVVAIVVFVKAFGKKGTPFRGGVVSGHSAVAFSLWTAIFFTQNNKFVITVSFLLALLVAQSRLRSKIHSFWEVAAGALVGLLATSIFFQLFS